MLGSLFGPIWSVLWSVLWLSLLLTSAGCRPQADLTGPGTGARAATSQPASGSGERDAELPPQSATTTTRAPGELPVVERAEPAVVRVRSPGHGRTLLYGNHLDRIDRVRVVSANGAPAPRIQALPVLTAMDSRLDPLLVELNVSARAKPGCYLLQLNTRTGGIYLPSGIARIEIEAPTRRSSKRTRPR